MPDPVQRDQRRSADMGRRVPVALSTRPGAGGAENALNRIGVTTDEYV